MIKKKKIENFRSAFAFCQRNFGREKSGEFTLRGKARIEIEIFSPVWTFSFITRRSILFVRMVRERMRETEKRVRDEKAKKLLSIIESKWKTINEYFQNVRKNQTRWWLLFCRLNPLTSSADSSYDTRVLWVSHEHYDKQRRSCYKNPTTHNALFLDRRNKK